MTRPLNHDGKTSLANGSPTSGHSRVEQGPVEVVVTGLGVVSPLGFSAEEFHGRMFAGESGVRKIRGSLVGESFPVPYAGWIDRSKVPAPRWNPGRRLGDSSLFALLATEEAAEGLTADEKIDAIVYGTAESIGYDIVQESFTQAIADEDLRRQSAQEVLSTLNEMLGATIDQNLPDSHLISINSACASGNQAIGLAMQRIREGQWTRAVVGGVDTRCNAPNLMNFNMLGALTSADVEPETASRPFDKERSGFVRGEGAATLILETAESAKARGAKILARVSGYGFTSDAYRLTDGRDDAAGVKKAMELAISDAGLQSGDISAISAHGTSTPLNDRLETKAIKEVFGDHAYQTPVSSLKSQIGHSTVAAGAIETVACVMMIEDQKLAPTINYESKDPDCDLDYVPNVAREAKIDHILSNNFGFGGQNACLTVSRFA